jgi:hypothetical protein
MRSGSDRIACAALAALLTLRARPAGAETPTVDSSYGRVDGDVTVAFGLGAVAAPRGARAGAELRLRYLESAGVFATYEEGGALGSPAAPTRVLATGVELRPLFLFRWLQGHEAEHPRFDLLVDSLGLELGAIFEQPAGDPQGWRRGIEVGLGVELPILERASGPWIGVRAALRWSDAALSSGTADDADDRQLIVAFTLSWHQLLTTHLVDLGDEAPR